MMVAKIPKQQETYNALIISISHQRSGLLQIKNSVMLTKNCKFAKYTHDCIDNFSKEDFLSKYGAGQIV